MNLLGGYPFSLIKNGLLYNYPALENNVIADVVVIGGGISGALMGHYLSNAGVDCVIVDSRTIGLGSTCASTSLLQYEIDVPLHILKDKVGLQNAVTAYKLCEEAITKIGDIDKEIGCGEFEPKMSLYFAAQKKQIQFIKNEFAIRKENGFEVTYMEEDVVKQLFGFNTTGAILSKSAGQTDAYKFTHALHQSSMQKGIRIFDRTAAVKIDHSKNSILLTAANGCTIRAKHIIYANGYEAVNYIDKKKLTLHSTFAAVSEQCTADINFWKDEVLLWNTADPYLYMRTTKDRRILVGGRDEPFKKTSPTELLVQRKGKLLKKDFEKLFPAIPYKEEFTWSGTFVTTEDGLPFIGALRNRPNSYFSLGFGGNGITFSLIGAEIITSLILTGKSNYSKLFSFNRP